MTGDFDGTLTISITAPGLDDEFGYDELCEFTDELNEALGSAGEVESTDIGPEDANVICWGADPEEMFRPAESFLKGHPLTQRAKVQLQSDANPRVERSFRIGD